MFFKNTCKKDHVMSICANLDEALRYEGVLSVTNWQNECHDTMTNRKHGAYLISDLSSPPPPPRGGGALTTCLATHFSCKKKKHQNHMFFRHWVLSTRFSVKRGGIWFCYYTHCTLTKVPRILVTCLELHTFKIAILGYHSQHLNTIYS